MQVVGLFRANIIDVAPDSLIVEVVGDEDKIDSLHELLKEFGVVEVMRTGTIALNRGSEAAKKESRKSKHRNWGEAASV